MSIRYPGLAALLTMAAATPTLAAPTASMSSGGSIAQAAAAFRHVCLAHPGDAAAQKKAAMVATPRAFTPEPGSPPGMESLIAWPLQLTLLDTPEGPACVILSPMVDDPKSADAIAEVRRRLKLGAGVAAGERHIWTRGSGARRQVIAFSVPIQTDALGKERPTAQLTLTAAKVK